MGGIRFGVRGDDNLPYFFLEKQGNSEQTLDIPARLMMSAERIKIFENMRRGDCLSLNVDVSI